MLVDPAQPGSGLYNAVLALLAPPNPDESERYDEEILDLPVVGYLVVCVYVLLCADVELTATCDLRTALDIPNKRMTILSPNHWQGSLIGRTAIAGSFEWQE